MWKVVENNRNNRSQSKHHQVKIRLWHIGSVMIISTTLLAVPKMPANAFLLNNLETKISSVIQQNDAGTETTTAQVVSSSFNVIRGIFLALLISTAIYSKLKPREQQSQQSKTVKVKVESRK